MCGAHNIKKAKEIPGTKETKTFLGPNSIEEMTPSHLLARKDSNSKATKLPIFSLDNTTHVNNQ